MNNRRFSFIRHGKVKGPAALYGKTDIEMNAHAQQDLLVSLDHLHHENAIDYIISSPLKRCALVAEEFSRHHLLPVEMNADLQECDFGDWDGKDFNSLKSEWPALEAFWQSPLSQSPPNGENLQKFADRVRNAWRAIQAQQTCEHTLILCHGGTIRIVIADILDIPVSSALFQQLHIDLCSHTYIEIGDYADAKPVIRWIGTVL
ncbi:MAG: histidine phosphatase family protein [Gammaproteobacteria bacterium]|nr:MAG: histidine phosphatase family protein [Gammaproteobacteria bacterium]